MVNSPTPSRFALVLDYLVAECNSQEDFFCTAISVIHTLAKEMALENIQATGDETTIARAVLMDNQLAEAMSSGDMPSWAKETLHAGTKDVIAALTASYEAHSTVMLGKEMA